MNIVPVIQNRRRERMYSLDRSSYLTRTILPLSLARGGAARVFALLLVGILALASVCYCQGNSDILLRSSSQFESGRVSVGYFHDGDFVEYNTPFTVCKGVVGWCLDRCPGPEGDVTLNITDSPIKYNGFTWLPGVLYVNPGQGNKGVAIEFRPNQSQAVNCVGSFAIKPDSQDTATVKITKNKTPLRNNKLDSAQKQDSSVLSTIAEVGINDRLYFSVSSTDNECCGLIGIQLFVTPVDAKVKTEEKLKPAFVLAKR